MKKIILTLALLMGVFAAQAQSLEPNKFFDNISVTLKGGAIMPFQGYAFWPSARGIFGLEIKKQLTPVFGLGVEGEATINTTSWEKDPNFWGPKSPNMIDHTLAGMFGTVNLSNLFGGYKGKPRVFEIEGVFGAGWLHAFHRTESADYYGYDYDSWYTKAGANLNFNFGESRAWTFSLKPAVVWDMNGDVMNGYRYNRPIRNWVSPHSNASKMNADHAGLRLVSPTTSRVATASVTSLSAPTSTARMTSTLSMVRSTVCATSSTASRVTSTPLTLATTSSSATWMLPARLLTLRV